MNSRTFSGVAAGMCARWGALLLLVPLAVFYAHLTWTDQLVGRGGDNALYVLMAQRYSPYGGFAAPGADLFTLRSPFPPAYPFLLALTGGAHDLLIAHQVTTACLVLAFALLLRLAGSMGLSPLLRGSLVAAFALLPGTYTQACYLLSENLFLCLTLGFFVILAAGPLTARRCFALSVLVALAALTRTVGVALLVAYAVHLSIRRPRQWLSWLALAGAPVLAWNLHRYAFGVHYLNQLAYADGGVGFLDNIFTQFRALQSGWVANLATAESLAPISRVTGALGLLGAVVRAARAHTDGLFVVAFLAIVLLWPYPAEAIRLVFAIVPFLLLHGTWLVQHALARIAPQSRFRHGGFALPVLALLVAMPDAMIAARRLQMPLPAPLAKFRHEPGFLHGREEEALFGAWASKAFATAVKGVAVSVPAGQCVYSTKPALVTLLSGRMSKAPPHPQRTQREFAREIGRDGCEYFLFLNMTSPTYGTPMYPYARVAGRVEILRRYDVTIEDSPVTIAALGRLPAGAPPPAHR